MSAKDTVHSIIHERNQLLQKFVSHLRIKDKRHIFTLMENHVALTHNTFFPHYGIRAGEFAVHYILGDNTQKSRRLKRKILAAQLKLS